MKFPQRRSELWISMRSMVVKGFESIDQLPDDLTVLAEF
jgi:hypothetical protein